MTDGDGKFARDFFARDAPTVARALIGSQLLIDGAGGIIVETEAYTPSDPASHSFGGPTRRNASMFGPPGHAYVYRIYGLHWCLNFVCSGASGVLIRALQPTEGLAVMSERRRSGDLHRLCAGPGRLCEALGVDGQLDGCVLDQPPFDLRSADAPPSVIMGPRIGISKGVDTPWRFCLEGSPFLSRRVTASHPA